MTYLTKLTRTRTTRLQEQVDQLTKELAATQKAKAENDERFQTEAIDARREADRLLTELGDARTALVIPKEVDR